MRELKVSSKQKISSAEAETASTGTKISFCKFFECSGYFTVKIAD